MAASPLATSPSRHAQVALHAFAALFLYGLIYRARLYYDLFVQADKPFQFLPERYSITYLLKFVVWELAVAAAIAGCALVVGRAYRLVWPTARTRIPLWVGVVLLQPLLFLVALLSSLHHVLIFTMETGLTREVVVESLSAPSLADTSVVRAADAVVLAAPLGLFWLSFALPARMARWRNRGLAVLAALVVLLNLVHWRDPKPLLAAELRQSPVWFAVPEVIAGIQALQEGSERPSRGNRPHAAGLDDESPTRDRPQEGPKKERAEDGPTAAPAPATFQAQLDSPRFVHPTFVRPEVQPKKTLPPAAKGPWNVVLVIMESTGLQYAFRTKVGNKVPMPFLQRLSEQSLFLANHFASGNSSPRAIFSILSGLNPMPQVRIFSLRKDLRIPSFATLLGESYEKFLVTPAPLDWYFPRAFVVNSGLKELWDYGSLPVRGKVEGRSMSKDEGKTVDFFLDRLGKVKGPFFGVYYSFVAHWPYPDYGAPCQVLPPVKPLYRYYNNLRCLDLQLERIYERLKSLGQLDRTILAVVGDHGEAFGQHGRNWTHSRGSYNENYQVPMLFHQPRLFAARKVTEATSHVDLLPTLVDAMGLKHEERLLQGESLFQDRFRRRYVFLWGNENTLTAIKESRLKLQISFKTNECWVFDLVADPDEQKRLSCKEHEEQRQAALLYQRYQTQLLKRYNDAAQNGRTL
ncbi:MAG: sulfatase-like hydrolase/transferase [Deltaproteobacteria bacterium]|nr:sulfatase-like hydrolase/transferase [Deltaproteobacteria bacterium]